MALSAQPRLPCLGGRKREPAPLAVEVDGFTPSRFCAGAWREALRYAQYWRRRGYWVRVTSGTRGRTWRALPNLFVVRRGADFLQWHPCGAVHWRESSTSAATFRTWARARAAAAYAGGVAVRA